MVRNLVSQVDAANGQWCYESIFYKSPKKVNEGDPASIAAVKRGNLLNIRILLVSQRFWTFIRYSRFRITAYTLVFLVLTLEFLIRQPTQISIYDFVEFLFWLVGFGGTVQYSVELVREYRKADQIIEKTEEKIWKLTVSKEEMRTEKYRRETFCKAAGFSINNFQVVPKREKPFVPKKKKSPPRHALADENIDSVEALAHFMEKKQKEIIEEKENEYFMERANVFWKNPFVNQVPDPVQPMQMRHSAPILENHNITEDCRLDIIKMKRFIYDYIVKDLINNLQELNRQLENGYGAYRADTMSIDTMRALASDPDIVQNHLPVLPAVLLLIDFNHPINVPYLLNEILYSPKYLIQEPFRYEEDYHKKRKEYTESKPSLNYIIYKLFLNFMDWNMKQSVNCGLNQAFSKNFTLIEDHYTNRGSHIAGPPLMIRCSNRSDPTFALLDHGSWRMFPKYDGVYRVLVDFFKHVKMDFGSRLSGCNLEIMLQCIFERHQTASHNLGPTFAPNWFN